MPKTKNGIWSLILVIVMPILLMVGPSFTNTLYAGVSSGDTLFQDIAARPVLALTMLAGFGCGAAAFITGLIALLKEKERTTLVFVSTIIGALVILYLIAEIAFPD